MHVNATVKPYKTTRGRIAGYIGSFASISTQTHETKEAAQDELIRMIGFRCDYRSGEVKILKVLDHLCVITYNVLGHLDVRHVWPDGHISLCCTSGPIEQAQESFRSHVAQTTWDHESLDSDLLTTEESRRDFRRWAQWQIAYKHGSEVLGLQGNDAHVYACNPQNWQTTEAA